MRCTHTEREAPSFSLPRITDTLHVCACVRYIQEAKLLSAKKALYLELMAQLILYLLMSIDTVDWSALLIVLAAYYLDAKRWNFLLMYLVLVTVSILFDTVHLFALPAQSHMTPGQAFGTNCWVLIFLLKPLIVATIYAYEKYEKPFEDGAGGGGYASFKDQGGPDDEIAGELWRENHHSSHGAVQA